MELVNFSIKNFRSIKKTSKLKVSKLTVLVGPNNEGKSNLLLGLVRALELIQKYKTNESILESTVPFYSSRPSYNWNRDFPVDLQQKYPKGVTTFDLEFKLSYEEVVAFEEQIKSSLNGTLPISLTVGRDGICHYKISKRGRGGKALSKKANRICKFIRDKVAIEYIPAIRTSESAINVINDIIENELKKLEADLEYTNAVKKINELQAPVLDRIGNNITETLKEFLPNVKDVILKTSEARRFSAFRRSTEVVINDGTPTILENKGDGVKSLAAISLLKYSSETGSDGRSIVLAIEEPESHLHPKAIHRLKEILRGISDKNQIIISSHCPLLVHRSDVASNIIVLDNIAVHAKNISEIRDVLGVKPIDNLTNARLVLIVEGECDKVALMSILEHKSPLLKKSLASGELVIDVLQGANKLNYKISLFKSVICDVHVFIDNDSSGKDAIKSALDEGLITTKDYRLSSCPGLKESEFEDLYDLNMYIDHIDKGYGVNLTVENFSKLKLKWSEKIEKCFIQQGKAFDDNLKTKLKIEVAKLAAAQANNCIHNSRIGLITNLVQDLEKKLTD